MHISSQIAGIIALSGLALMSLAQENGNSEPDKGPEPFTVTFETTYRPQYTDTDTESAQYFPIPLTPDLGQIANSLASQPSVAAVMRNAQYQQESAAANPRIEL